MTSQKIRRAGSSIFVSSAEQVCSNRAYDSRSEVLGKGKSGEPIFAAMSIGRFCQSWSILDDVQNSDAHLQMARDSYKMRPLSVSSRKGIKPKGWCAVHSGRFSAPFQSSSSEGGAILKSATRSALKSYNGENELCMAQGQTDPCLTRGPFRAQRQ